MRRRTALSWSVIVLLASPALASEAASDDRASRVARSVVEYFEAMSEPEPFTIRRGEAFESHRASLREAILRSIGLWPLPERVPLEARETAAIEHPWCTVRRVYYRLWPGVRAHGLLFLPKETPENPAPAVLCPHGHWSGGHAHPTVQSRCLVLAKLGYVVFSPAQQHYEDLNWGISHQTIGVWSNLRAIDYLTSLEQVDSKRIGVCGASGGGLQTQMLCALEPRLGAAAIAGMTCDYREILFPHAAHCGCNHFPRFLLLTDGPELSALGLPLPVLYLSMNDWTARFERVNFPTVRLLYEAHGVGERVESVYEPTNHDYDRSKRERTYRWLERWLRGREHGEAPLEPDVVETLPPQVIAGLTLDLPDANAFREVSSLYRRQHEPALLVPKSSEEWRELRERGVESLRGLLGEDAVLPCETSTSDVISKARHDDTVEEILDVPGEGPLRIPVRIFRPARVEGRLPVVVMVAAFANDAPPVAWNRDSRALELVRQGFIVVLPDIRFVGELSFESIGRHVGPELAIFQPSSPLSAATDAAARARSMRYAWERNAIVWGRPPAAMAATDLRFVIDAIAARDDADLSSLRIVARGSGDLAVAAIFAAVLDPRVTALDADLVGASFGGGGLSPVPFVLGYGDVLTWVALLADRDVTLRGLPSSLGDPGWLRTIFEQTDLAGMLRVP